MLKVHDNYGEQSIHHKVLSQTGFPGLWDEENCHCYGSQACRPILADAELFGEAPHRSLLKSPPSSEPGLQGPVGVISAQNDPRALLKAGDPAGHVDIRDIFELQNAVLSSGVRIKGHSGAAFVEHPLGPLPPRKTCPGHHSTGSGHWDPLSREASNITAFAVATVANIITKTP
ncbi:hypothetical protein DUI87_32701 [Hirundo rustica rustica]|uniref:Uncharacterized protein n=1 Tax=Hirundo rustica rustica TaxID=333673 RepID=A0A3M0IR39_HIRRU|nr:hypothetical protein DUI87_32701 [Hirundo rustica rustica]